MSVNLKNLPKHTKIVENILAVYNEATPEDVLEGMEWYPQARVTCENLASMVDYDVQQIAGVMAILSPGMVWDANKTAPGRVLDLHTNGVPWKEWTGFATYPHNLEKAERVLNGDMSGIKGNKVESFYMNILGYDRFVTVDRWACRIAFGNPKIPGKQSVPSSKKVYNKIAEAYKDAARVADIPNSTIQAITWVSYRRRYNGRVVPQRVDVNIEERKLVTV